DELARVAGVGEVALPGHTDDALRVRLDPDRLAERRLNARDLARPLAKEKEAGELDTEKFANRLLRADADRGVVRLKEVARVEVGAGRRRSEALLDGKPVVALVVQPTGEISPKQLRAALGQRLAEVRARLPEGLNLVTIFDFTANREALPRQG